MRWKGDGHSGTQSQAFCSESFQSPGEVLKISSHLDEIDCDLCGKDHDPDDTLVFPDINGKSYSSSSVRLADDVFLGRNASGRTPLSPLCHSAVLHFGLIREYISLHFLLKFYIRIYTMWPFLSFLHINIIT